MKISENALTMNLTLAEKIILSHLVTDVADTAAFLKPGAEISLKIDQTLTQDSTGTMAYLQLEALSIERVKTKLSVAYVDHNMLQVGHENADDHRYIQSVTSKHGVFFSRPGNGVCHQVHLERFGVPGDTLLGSDSHTPTAGGIGMLAIGAGGLDVAVAMSGGAYSITMPEIVNIRLSGKLKPFVSAKDIILEVLRRLTVKGGVGKIIEYSGEGVKTLSVPQRATITNMGAELGATTSIFPSDEVTEAFLTAQGRGKSYKKCSADIDALYSQTIDINLSELEPLCAAPHSPDNIVSVKECSKIKVHQVAIGSCTNGSFADISIVADILKDKTVHEDVSLLVSPGSRNVLLELTSSGAIEAIVKAGGRLIEPSCGPCIGMGGAPASNSVSLRTYNRNFKGRSGTASADVYLCSPETAAISALTGYITDPSGIADTEYDCLTQTTIAPDIDNMIIPPSDNPDEVVVIRGPNIKPFPLSAPLEETIESSVLIKLGDNITTDDIMPSDAKLLPYRSNIPYLAEFCLTPCDENFPRRAKASGGGIIIAGDNYGQGSSREHAALVPLFLGIKAVIAKSFARIHKANLINNGIIPLTFKNPSDYDTVFESDIIKIEDALRGLESRVVKIEVCNNHGKRYIETCIDCSQSEINMLIAGGKINYIKNQQHQ